jgi:Holliday junction resolvasome RuvABC DNA-binding subunit
LPENCETAVTALVALGIPKRKARENVHAAIGALGGTPSEQDIIRAALKPCGQQAQRTPTD